MSNASILLEQGSAAPSPQCHNGDHHHLGTVAAQQQDLLYFTSSSNNNITTIATAASSAAVLASSTPLDSVAFQEKSTTSNNNNTLASSTVAAAPFVLYDNVSSSSTPQQQAAQCTYNGAQNLSIFFTGPPGSGKTTQIDMLKQFFSNLPLPLHIVIGKQLKKEGEIVFADKSKSDAFILPNGLPFGSILENCDDGVKELLGINKFKSCLMLRRALERITTQEQCKPFVYIFSRGPATGAYASILNDHLQIKPDVYFVLESDDEDMLLQRVINRRFDTKTNKTYNIMDVQQQQASAADKEELARLEALYKRIGDTKENFPKRIKKYRYRSGSTLDYYKEKFNNTIPIVKLAAARTREDIHAEIVSVVKTLLQQKYNM